jgi:hypothetical protein
MSVTRYSHAIHAFSPICLIQRHWLEIAHAVFEPCTSILARSSATPHRVSCQLIHAGVHGLANRNLSSGDRPSRADETKLSSIFIGFEAKLIRPLISTNPISNEPGAQRALGHSMRVELIDLTLCVQTPLKRRVSHKEDQFYVLLFGPESENRSEENKLRQRVKHLHLDCQVKL